MQAKIQVTDMPVLDEQLDVNRKVFSERGTPGDDRFDADDVA